MGRKILNFFLLFCFLLSAYLYVDNLKTEKEFLIKEKEILIKENETLVFSNTKLREQVENVNKNILILNDKLNKINQESEQRKNIFDDHNLDNLLKKKNKLMEKKINKAIEKTFGRFEK